LWDFGIGHLLVLESLRRLGGASLADLSYLIQEVLKKVFSTQVGTTTAFAVSMLPKH
jgi:hypothetical protein